MSARFCPHCGTSISANANFCKNCGNRVAESTKTTGGPSKELNSDLLSDVSVEDAPKVPAWNGYYPNLSEANAEQKRFYAFWKDNLENGIPIEIDNNLGYLFVYAYDVIHRFVVNKDINQLVASFERLQKGYSSQYKKIPPYLDSWLADAWLYLDRYDEAWGILRKRVRLQVRDILNIRAKCSDTSIDGNDLLHLIGNRLSAKFNREQRENVANLAATYLADSHQRNGTNFVEHFCRQFNLSDLTTEDIDKLETFFPENEEFLQLLLEWQHDKLNPKYMQNEAYLFNGVPFGTSSLALTIDPKTGEAEIITDGNIQQPRIASLEIPKIVERALILEIKKILENLDKPEKPGPQIKANKRRYKKAAKIPISRGGVIKEDLPYPVVYYPNSYGTFFGFAKNESSQIALCLCSKPAIENLIRLKQENPRPYNAKALRRALFDSWFFPDVIASTPLKNKLNPLDDLLFVEGLCHRCNVKPPLLRYCHEMYGGEFIQRFGWYVNQEYLRLGIWPMHFFYLKDVCPPEYQTEIQSFQTAQKEYRDEYLRLTEQSHGPRRTDIAPDERTYWHNVTKEDAKEMIKRRRKSARDKRAFTSKIENSIRQKFGFKNIGDEFVSETLLYQIVERILNGKEVLRHHRPDWLEGLELDIFVPSLNLAFEYQGEQHFHPIEVWGGAKALEAQQERDRRKADLCEANGIDLIYIYYTESLTEKYIRKILKDEFFPPK